MTTYCLGSCPMVSTPGLIAWAINGYAFKADRARLLNVIATTIPTVPAAAIKQLLAKDVPYSVDAEAETVTFTVEG